jgi:DNA-binding CsgD family transcriptional regulator
MRKPNQKIYYKLCECRRNRIQAWTPQKACWTCYMETRRGQRHATITDRELSVVKRIAEGAKQTTVATELKISYRTLVSTLGRAYRKIGVNNNVDLTRWAIFVGVIRNSDPRPPIK